VNDDQVKSLPIGRLMVWGLAIAFVLTILFQNLQPLVVLYFLGRFTIPLPLSVAIFGAFTSGAITALIFNLISAWLRRRRDRTIADLYEADLYDDDLEEDEPQAVKTESRPPKSNPLKSPPEFDDDDEDTYEYGLAPKKDRKRTRYEDEDDDREIIDVKYIDRN